MKIQNLDIYRERMAKSLVDKVFFLDYIDEDVEYILDYGCADGVLLKSVSEVTNDTRLFGYDNSDEMIAHANIDNPKKIIFSTNLEELKSKIKPEETMLILSSLIHEVYSYCCESEVEQFWDFVLNTGFRYISIRDMMHSRSMYYQTEKSSVNKLLDNFDNSYIKDFESIHGSINDNKNFVHFLLKYKYVENWEREVNENYFPICIEELLDITCKGNYEVVLNDHYILPYTKDLILSDFGIDLKDNTHMKLILKRK